MRKNLWMYVSVLCVLLLIFIFSVAILFPSKPISIIPEIAAYFNHNLQEVSIQTNNQYNLDALKNKKLKVPVGYKISVYAGNMTRPRLFTFDQADNMFITDMDKGKLYLFKDQDKDGIAETQILVDKDLNLPHNAVLYKGDLYLALFTGVIVYKGIDQDGKYTEKKTLISNIPTDGHSTRTIQIGNDEKIYLSVGSDCNLCEEKDPRRAAITQYNLDGSGEKLYASGLRNAVGFVFNSGEMWATDNGRDLIGDDIPPEEINKIEDGKDYGWPYCYGNQIPNPEYSDRTSYCESKTEKPAYEMTAHSAPLGLTFVPEGSVFAGLQKTNIIAALHGSWNRSTPSGYKLISVDTISGSNKPIDFITGWLVDNKAWGRPVGVQFNNAGDLFISDDMLGVVYKVSKV